MESAKSAAGDGPAAAAANKPAAAAAADDKPANCYCGRERSLGTVELLCATCNRWFHEPCIGVQLGKLIPFATNYVFFCKGCSPNGAESFRKCQASECFGRGASRVPFCV